ncbi:MAG: aldo/keto reductase, partial [bacterium]
YAHQVEMHPWLPQKELRKEASNHGTRIVAYSPFAHGEAFEEEAFQRLASDQGCSVAQLLLAWALEQDVIPIPKATGEDHLRDNFEALDVNLDESILEELNSSDRGYRYIDPPFAPW